MTSKSEDDSLHVFSDVACTVCGCVCDDLCVAVEHNRMTHVENACELAQPWFAALRAAQDELRPAALIEGRPATVEAAIARSAEILAESRAPLIWGLSRSSTSGQRAAVRLGEIVGANIDTTASVCHAPSIMAIQTVGESTSSLGEIRNRADLVIFWGANPVESHPRHFERYSVDATGLFVPRGRADRHLIVIDTERTATSALADSFVQVPADRDFELIWAIRHLLRGRSLPESFDVGISHADIRLLTERMAACRYGVVFFGLGLAQRGMGHANVEALLRLVAELNRHTRFTARRLRIPGDVTGADSILCWQTGYPFAVNLARGYPRYNPGEFTANDLLARGEVDVCLLVGSESVASLSRTAQQAIGQLPTISLDYPNHHPTVEATVQFTTAIYGIHAPGTAYRMDELPIPLRKLVQSNYPTDDEILRAIAEQMECVLS